MSVCSCESPDAALVEGLLVCSRCGERVRDPMDAKRDATLAAIARTVASVDRRLTPSNGNGADAPATEPLSFTIPPAFLEAVAQRAAEIVAAGHPTVEDGWLRGADAIADYIGAPRSRVYALANTQPPRIPVHRDGSSYVAQRSELDAWVRSGGGKRP